MHNEAIEHQGWGDLLALAADLAFETDRWGRFLFLSPEAVLGWPAGALLHKPAELLLASPGSIAGFNPFRAAIPVRGRRAWLNRSGGGQTCLRFTCTPLLDADGVPVGTRGIGMLEPDAEAPRAWGPEAAIDGLSGLPNRHAFVAELSRRIERLDRDRLTGTLMWANLDSFRTLNGRLGPAVGDKVLARVAALLSATLRPTDLVSRLGGDEFAMWLSGADHMTAAERAEALRRAVPEATAGLVGPAAPPVGISIGIAERSLGSGETIEMLMRRAERAMFAVKHGGKGHWRVAHVTEP
jgi:diguanylate cyclase (GGDEF)-like protein